MLGQFRLLCFAQAGSMSSLPGFHPSENPLFEPVKLASPFCSISPAQATPGRGIKSRFDFVSTDFAASAWGHFSKIYAFASLLPLANMPLAYLLGEGVTATSEAALDIIFYHPCRAFFNIVQARAIAPLAGSVSARAFSIKKS